MKITFLGTGTSQGIPVIGSKHPVCLSNNSKDKRLRVSVMVSWDSYNYVIDCGPDFRQQMLANNVVKIDGILFTHEHSDHTAGIDDIRPFFFRQGDIPIYAHERVVTSIKERFDYIFADENRYPGAPAVEINTIKNNKPFRIGNLMAIPVEAQHNRLQVFGFRIQDFVYLTDVKSMEKVEMEKIKGVNTLVVNALRIEPHHSHFNLEEALEFIDIVKPKTAYLTHISHLLGFHDEVEKQLPDNVHLAYDNLVIEV
ncbi:phosphoribosyl 1,2-cyclic phosphate phosphodiesterase [Arenibacter palladensis]|uniref:Phosphoribosyl 1,2-cyclic phosphate phosphodiesterase n=1 Tax=Arenibacter palladensis TaxID=237373 RepID=A0A1M4ZAU8_9FLAO|nr:MBL fold metallo-hydrolase [Arenibacter palladensis]MDO6601708.1 MBL fold metallo-hydrolase [Arenibacter palladensis]SHF15173.1 phosphoribosyl 1,2-cyclic phosphate phosphodiesterase [Arenibacter palladensis]